MKSKACLSTDVLLMSIMPAAMDDEPAPKVDKKRKQRLRQIKEGKKRAVDQEAAVSGVAAVDGVADDDRIQEESSSIKVDNNQAVTEQSTAHSRIDPQRTAADFWPGINLTESKEANAKLSPVFSKDGR